MSNSKRVNPFAPAPSRKKANRQQANSRPSATQVALRQFGTATPNRSAQNQPAASNARSFQPSPLPNANQARTITSRLPVVFTEDLLVKILKRDLQLTGQAISRVFQAYPVFAQSIIDHHRQPSRRDVLVQKYSSTDHEEKVEDQIDDPFADFLEKKKKEKKIVVMKLDDEGVDKSKTKTHPALTGPVVKFSLPLDLKWVKKFDSRSKVRIEDLKVKLGKNITNFTRVLDAKMFNLACHALPIMEDKETSFSKQQRDEICQAATGVKFSTLCEWRDAWYFRAISKKRWAEFLLQIEPKDDYPSIKKKGSNHGKLKEAIAEAQKAFKKGRSPTKVEALFLRLFPGFISSPLYKA